MVILSLLLTLFVMLIMCYYIFKRDIMSPPFLVVSGFTLSTICVVYNYNYWNVTDMGWITYKVIIGGLSVFILSSCVVYAIFGAVAPEKKIILSESLHKPSKLTPIHVSALNIKIFLAYSIIITILYYHEVLRVVGNYDSLALSEILSNFRSESSYSTISTINSGNKVSTIINFGFLAMSLGSAICLFICINNVLCRKKISVGLIISSLLFLLSFLKGERTTITICIFMALVVFYLSHMQNCNWKKLKAKYLFIIIIFIGLTLALFCAARFFIGRGTIYDPIYYVTLYFGGSIRLLDLYLKFPFPKDDIWGRETFCGINNAIGRFFNKPELIYLIHKEFRDINGNKIGNVYTAFRSYIHDFGYGGMIILTSLFSAFNTIGWNIIRRKIMSNQFIIINAPVLIYSYLYYSVAMMFFADGFYVSSPITILKVIIILTIMVWFFTKLRIVWHSSTSLSMLNKQKQTRLR